MFFKENLKRLRIQNNFTQQEIANQLGILLQSYQKYESGERQPKLNELDKFIIIFNCDYNELLKEKKEMKK